MIFSQCDVCVCVGAFVCECGRVRDDKCRKLSTLRDATGSFPERGGSGCKE